MIPSAVLPYKNEVQPLFVYVNQCWLYFPKAVFQSPCVLIATQEYHTGFYLEIYCVLPTFP